MGALTTTGGIEQGRPPTNRQLRKHDILLLTHPRTASNLLTRLLSTQAGWIQKEYHFRGAFKFSRESCTWDESLLNISCDEDRQQFESLFQKGLAKLCTDRDAARAENKGLMIKTHTCHLWEPSKLRQESIGGDGPGADLRSQSSHASTGTTTNPTLLEDDFLASWQPVFLIRHPALVFESWYRAESQVAPIEIRDSVWSCFMTFRHHRQLYDWYASNGTKKGLEAPTSRTPIVVIDADDIIDGESAMSKLCEMCNMDPQSICREWEAKEPAGTQALSARHLSFMNGFWQSTSIDKSKSSRGLDIAAKHAEWKDKFGVDVANVLLAKVEEAMVDYEYMWEKRI